VTPAMHRLRWSPSSMHIEGCYFALDILIKG